MLATVVIDKYKKTETEEILKALKILTVENSQDWSTAGLYCYWDYYNNEVLYIGLAVDLFERFKQHNGISECNPKSCKIDKINNYFNSKEYIGFSVILQSSLSQPVNQRQVRKYANFSKSELINIFGVEGADEIRYTEGVLIEGFKNKYGRLPQWNEIGGSKQAQKIAKGKNVKMLEYLTLIKPNKYVSRVSLRELSKSCEFLKYETYLHSIRMSPFSSEETIKMHQEKLGIFTFKEIADKDYFKKRLKI